jgi:hypothetical protein
LAEVGGVFGMVARKQPMPNCAENQIMAMYAYVDDSGSEPSQPLYVLGGLILPEETWEIFSGDWKYVLHVEPRIEYFKASEVWDRRKGPFRDLTTKQRSNRVDALADLISVYRPLSISTRVEWPVFKQFADRYKLDDEFNDPYFFLFFALIGQVAVLSTKQPKFANTNFVFDEQGRVGVHARLWYLLFRKHLTDRIQSLLGEWPETGDEKKIMPLQGADLFAWYQRRSVLGNLGHESHQRIWGLFKDLQYSTVLEEEHLERIALDLRFPRK